MNRRRLCQVALALGFMAAGFNHFLRPAFYVGIMPPYFPHPLELVYLSGLGEIFGGAGLLLRRTRRAAAWSLIALLLAVFPANLHMVWNGFRDWPAWLLWARLPLQGVFIAFLYFSSLAPPASKPGPEEHAP